MEVRDIKIEDVKISENIRVGKNDREIIELMQSIKQDGLLNAIVVLETKKGIILESGFRRLSACKKLGWKTIPAHVKQESFNKQDMIIAQTVENIQRRNITPRELGRICYHLINDEKLSLAEVATRLAKPVDRIRGAIKLYKDLPSEYRDEIVYTEGTHGFGRKGAGKIAADVALKALNMRSRHNLTRQQTKQLFETIKSKELSGAQLNTVGSILTHGGDMKAAIKEAENYKSYNCIVTANRTEIEALALKAGVKVGPYILGIVYGEYPPLKKPEMFNYKVAEGVK